MIYRAAGRLLVAVVAAALVLVDLGPAQAAPAAPSSSSAPVMAAQAAPSSAAASRPRWRPEEGGKFNVPRAGGDTMMRLHDQVLSAIRHARPKSDIRFSMFSFDFRTIAKALVDAKRRGVSVKVLVNDHEVTGAQRYLRKRIGSNRKKNSWIYQCTNGCRSSGENLHSKFYLFSHTGAARNVVMTGSVNMKMNGAKNQYNDLWTHNDNEKLYKVFNQYFMKLKNDKVDKPLYYGVTTGPYKLFFMPFPNHTPKRDPIMRTLRQVKCFGAQGNTGSNGRTVIRVVMHSWGEDRGTYIARRLRNLYGNGCDVKLLYGFSGAKVRRELSKPTARGKIPIRSTGYDTNEDLELDLYTHQKQMTISGHYGDDRSTNLVMTGSSNWTKDGTHGDEMIILINGQGALPAYRADFQWLWDNRSHSVAWSPTPGPDFVPAPTGGAGRLTGADIARKAPYFEPGLDGFDQSEE